MIAMNHIIWHNLTHNDKLSLVDTLTSMRLSLLEKSRAKRQAKSKRKKRQKKEKTFKTQELREFFETMPEEMRKFIGG